MKNKIKGNNFSILNYIAIELLAQLNCINPSEKLINKAESLLVDIKGESKLNGSSIFNYILPFKLPLPENDDIADITERQDTHGWH
jgi:hypothetical protein